MAKFGSALTADRFEAQQMVAEELSSAPNLAVAMESIGAMYGIPSSHILVDNNTKNVKVMNEHIICPGNVSAVNNGNTIIRSIGSVLDQISARINEKLDNLQFDNTTQGRQTDEVISRSDPSKGKVVATYKDANGELVLVYDSGIIDAPHTPEGRAKADEIRANGNAPTLNPLTPNKPAYFNDEDDLTSGVDMSANDTVSTEYCISDIIGESAFFLDAMAKYGEESPLGQAILTAHGYDCVRPTTNIVQEAATGKKLGIKDIKYMKFDNKKIYKAIDYLNKARAEQSAVKHPEDLNMDQFVRNPNYLAAIKCLEDQFDCHLAIKWIHSKKDESMAGTMIIKPEYRNKLTVSKSKGFQLGGSPIWIAIVEEGITSLISEDQKIFGQGVVSILLHEIFHNIAGIIRYENAEFVTTLNATIEEAIDTRDPKSRRIILERYTNMLNVKLGGKLGKAGKRLMVKRLSALISAESDTRLMTQYNNAVSEDDSKQSKADKMLQIKINNYKKSIKESNKAVLNAKGWNVAAIIVGAFDIIVGIIGVILLTAGTLGYFIACLAFGWGIGTVLGASINLVRINEVKKLYEKYNNSKSMEEYYSDLMSAMYQLPQRFFVVGKYNANEISTPLLEEWVKVEKEAYQSFMHIYPTTSERTWAGVTIAKRLLECKGLDKSVKSYLEWIVQNNDSILKTGIKEDYNSHTFDPAEAENLDAHLSSLIKNNKITVTESVMKELVDSTEIRQWIQEGMTYSDEEKDYMEWLSLSNEYDHIVQEASRLSVTGYKDESLGKRVLMFIPRLLAKIVEIIYKIGGLIVNGGVKLSLNMAISNDEIYYVTADIESVGKAQENVVEFVDHLYSLSDKISNFESYCNFLRAVTKAYDGKKYIDLAKEIKETSGNLKDFAIDEALKMTETNDTLKENKGKTVKVRAFKITGRKLKDIMYRIYKDNDSVKAKLKRMLDKFKRIMPDEKDTKELPADVKEGATAFCDMLKMFLTLYRGIYYVATAVQYYSVSNQRKKQAKQKAEEVF